MFWQTLGRMVIVPIAFILSALTATALILLIGLERLTQSVQTIGDDEQSIAMIFDVLTQGTAVLSALTIIPALAVVIIGEVAKIRSLLYYVVGGGAALAALPLLARLGTSAAQEAGDPVIWHIFATGGFAAGLLYWLIAGRNA